MEDVRPRFRVDCLDMGQPAAWPPFAKRIAAFIARLTGWSACTPRCRMAKPRGGPYSPPTTGIWAI